MSESPHTALMKFLAATAIKLDVAKHIYVVGGAVRNFVIDKPIKDIDVVVDSVALKGKDSEWFAKQLQRVISVRTNLTTNQYGVAILTISDDWDLDGFPMKGEVIEIANAREESYGSGGKGYKPSDVTPASIQADVYRREFTFNTLMWRLSDLAKGPDKAEIVDITGCGLSDLKAGVMACPSNPDKTFSDDPTRMLRAIKFLLRYGFKVEGGVADAIRRNANKLRNAPQEAIAMLLMGEILHEKTAAQALKAMKDLGLLAVLAEMLDQDKAFARTMANWANDKSVMHLFDLLDHGLPLATPMSFLTPTEQDTLRKIAVGMPSGEAEELLGVLRQPTKALGDKDFMPKLAAERGVSPKNMGPLAAKVNAAIKAAILDKPSLLKQPDTLKEIARASVVVTERRMFNREALENITKVEAKDPPIMGLATYHRAALPPWRIKSKQEAVWSPAKDHEYRINLERGGWEFTYFAPGASTGERSGPKTTFVHGYKAADAAEADWKERSSKDKTEAAYNPGVQDLYGKDAIPFSDLPNGAEFRIPKSDSIKVKLKGNSYTEKGVSKTFKTGAGSAVIPVKATDESLDEKSPPGWEGTVKAMKKHPEITNPWALAWSMKNKGQQPHYKLNKKKQPVKTEEGLHSAVAGLRSVPINESMSRYCEIWKASNDKWYLDLADEEYGEREDADTYGPFSSESAAEKYLDKFSNPGAMDLDDSGTRPPPTEAPNGSPVRKPR